MNDEWSRCPICFEDYSSTHRPTTFVCGHSTCLNHTVGLDHLRFCPICRHPLKEQKEYHISYSLEEASRLFQLLKNTIDWSTVKLPAAPIVSESRDAEMVHRDEICARRLQAEMDREIRNAPSRRPQVLVENQPLPIVEIPRVATVNNLPSRQQNGARQKNCGHRCDLISTNRCCPCSDRRPQRPNNGYEAYVDGRGIENGATRDAFYCPCCKHR